MNTAADWASDVARRVLHHLMERVQSVPALDEPFAHVYLENVFPEDVYRQILGALPDPALYRTASERHHGDAYGNYVRWMYPLTPAQLGGLPCDRSALWTGVAAALTDPAFREVLYTKLGRGLAYRYGIREDEVPRLVGHSRPTLYRETDGFEIPPHPDTRRKVVTMQLYLPADDSQLELGTALYRRKLSAWPFGDWRLRFARVKQFAFAPNSGYAFVVTNTLRLKSWHGRERLPSGAGTRNTLLNTFYEEQRSEFTGYLREPGAAAA